MKVPQWDSDIGVTTAHNYMATSCPAAASHSSEMSLFRGYWTVVERNVLSCRWSGATLQVFFCVECSAMAFVSLLEHFIQFFMFLSEPHSSSTFYLNIRMSMQRVNVPLLFSYVHMHCGNLIRGLLTMWHMLTQDSGFLRSCSWMVLTSP